MTAAEALLLAFGAGLGALALSHSPTRRSAHGMLTFVGATLLVGSAAALTERVMPRRASASMAAALPVVALAAPMRKLRSYAGSESCRSCHPSEHASWHRSYHRTMTTRPTAETALAPMDVTFEVDGQRTTLRKNGDRVDAEGADGARVPLRLATGSHHYQAYWTDGPRPGELVLLPFVFLATDRRFAPRRAVFLTSESKPPNDLPWSTSCIQCHAVAGRPGRAEDGSRFDTEVAEVGIACEACHGPGAAHADKHRNPLTRALAHGRAEADSVDGTIVNPKRLAPEEATAVCAQCHSLSFPRDEATFWEKGSFSPRPQRPWDTRTLLTYETLADPTLTVVEAPRESLFWRDGTIRVGGREANAHLVSPCFVKGEGDRKPSCLSCHSMHASDPNDQLARGKEGDGACTSCHTTFATQAHTRHASSSAGSRCASCHMPKTTFALLGAIRNHRIESPKVGAMAVTGRLPACNLCHLDQSVTWTDRTLAEWGVAGATSGATADHATHPDDRRALEETSALRWLLSGDAAQRALAAAHLGMAESRAASGVDWQPPLLAELLVDPYPAVRYVAEQSLRSIAGFEDLSFDFVGAPAQRELARAETRARFDRLGLGARVPEPMRSRVLLTRVGASDEEGVRKMTSHRDDRAITIAE